jgi:hypothetical protein
MKRLMKNLLDQQRGFFSAFAAPRRISLDSRETTLGKTASPQTNRLSATAKLPSDLLIVQTRVGQ